jgi:hypothetical protein
MQAISWTASQAAVMAEVIPVVALALGLELREVRKYFEGRTPGVSSGKHTANENSKDHTVATEGTGDQETVKEFLLRRDSRSVMIGFWGCLAMIFLLVGEQSAIAIVLGRATYNNLNIESLGMRAALTIVFLSPVAQIILSFMEAGFRQKKTAFNRRYRILSATMLVMTAVAFAFIYRGY